MSPHPFFERGVWRVRALRILTGKNYDLSISVNFHAPDAHPGALRTAHSAGNVGLFETDDSAAHLGTTLPSIFFFHPDRRLPGIGLAETFAPICAARWRSALRIRRTSSAVFGLSQAMH